MSHRRFLASRIARRSTAAVLVLAAVCRGAGPVLGPTVRRVTAKRAGFRAQDIYGSPGRGTPIPGVNFTWMCIWNPHQQECQLGLFEQATDDPLSGYVLHVSLPDAGSGGLAHSTDGWIAALDPAAQRQLRTAYWNDVRLHLARAGSRRASTAGKRSTFTQQVTTRTRCTSRWARHMRTRPFAGETYECVNRTTALEEDELVPCRPS